MGERDVPPWSNGHKSNLKVCFSYFHFSLGGVPEPICDRKRGIKRYMQDTLGISCPFFSSCIILEGVILQPSWPKKKKGSAMSLKASKGCGQRVFFFLPSCEPRQCQPDFLWYFVEVCCFIQDIHQKFKCPIRFCHSAGKTKLLIFDL